MALWDLFLNNTGRPIYKHAGYFPVYERFLAPYANRPVKLLEIGVGWGGSLQMWKQYLGPLATIVGIDNNERCKEYESRQVHVRIGDQADLEFLDSVGDEFGWFDIVIDDASHVGEKQIESFKQIGRRMANGGVYIVEDIHVADQEEFNDTSFVKFATDFCWYLDLEKTISAVHWYPGMVVFERGPTNMDAMMIPPRPER